jgi:hypothetical protein
MEIGTVWIVIGISDLFLTFNVESKKTLVIQCEIHLVV